MKHLRIDDDRNGYFRRGDSWIVVTEMTKDDLLNLAHAAVEEEDFELDAYEDSKLPNAAHKIIYQKYGDNLLNCIIEEKLFKRKYVISTRMHIKSIVQINYSEGKINRPESD